MQVCDQSLCPSICCPGKSKIPRVRTLPRRTDKSSKPPNTGAFHITLEN